MWSRNAVCTSSLFSCSSDCAAEEVLVSCATKSKMNTMASEVMRSVIPIVVWEAPPPCAVTWFMR